MHCRSMFARAGIPLVVAAMLAGACGGGNKHAKTPNDVKKAPPEAPKDFNTQPPGGVELAPAVFSISSFWAAVDEVCEAIAANAAQPAGVADEVWTDLTDYCDPSAQSRSLAMAGAADRDQKIGDVLTSLRHVDLRAACSEALRALEPLETAPKVAKLDGVKELRAMCAARSIPAPRVRSFSALRTVRAIATPDGTPVAKAEAIVDKFALEAKAKADAAAPTVAALPAPAALPGAIGAIEVSTLVSNALYGLAQFLVKRAELELRTFAVEKLRQVAQCGQNTVRSRLLADTCAFLGRGEGTLPGGFGPGLRAAFTRDLMSLPRRFVREVPAEGGEAQLFARVALESASLLVEDPEPLQIVARIKTLAGRTGEAFTCKPATETCEEAKGLLYLGAVIAELVLTDGRDIRLTAENLFDRLNAQKQQLLAEISSTTQLHAALTNVLNSDWKVLFARLREQARLAIDGFAAARSALATGGSEPAQIAQRILNATRHALRGVDRSIAIASCMRQVAQAGGPIDCATERTYMPGRLADLLEAIVNKDIVAIMAAALDLAQGAIPKERYQAYITPDMARLISFGAELANAKKPEEAEAAIEAIAMPPGGWKEKRKRSFLSITGLVGITVGGESVAGEEDGVGLSTGLTGAVGIDWNHNIEDSQWTTGVFITLIDLGALLNVRSVDNTISEEMTIDEAPPIGFAEVFAPAVGFRLGIAKSPVVAMIGGQIIPNGRTIIDDGGNDDPADDTSHDANVVRVMFTLAVDVTIWAF